jgi:S-adenosylmethionine hydrolase
MEQARRASPEEAVRAALVAVLDERCGHSGACCVLDAAGQSVVLPDSCCCSPVVKRARAALAATVQERTAWLGPRRRFSTEEMGR